MSTILATLEENCISTCLSEDKTIFSFYESLEFYGKFVDLTKADLRLLIIELLVIHNKMVEKEL